MGCMWASGFPLFDLGHTELVDNQRYIQIFNRIRTKPGKTAVIFSPLCVISFAAVQLCFSAHRCPRNRGEGQVCKKSTYH